MKKPTNVLAKLTSFIQPILSKLKTRLGPNPNQKLLAIAFILVFATIGVYFLLATKAAGPFASLEPEQGSGLTALADQSASGGAYVQFGSSTTTPPPPSSGGCPPYPAFPDANCTGYAHTGVTLSTYTGPCTITSPTTIDSKIINCGQLLINSTGVVVTRSKLNGTIFTDYHINYNPTFTDVEINGGKSIGACIGPLGGTYTRINVYGCSQGMQMQGFTLRDSYIHDLHSGPDGPCQTGVNNAHGSGVAGKYSSTTTPNTIIHNRIIANNLTYDPWCSVPPAMDNGGVSAAVTLYTHGDIWGNQSNIHFEKNFMAHGDGSNDRRDFGGYCLYAGSTDGIDGQGISNSKFFDNVFDRNPASPENPDLCGFGGAVTYSIKSGVCWSNNKYETGELVSVPGTSSCQ